MAQERNCTNRIYPALNRTFIRKMEVSQDTKIRMFCSGSDIQCGWKVKQCGKLVVIKNEKEEAQPRLTTMKLGISNFEQKFKSYKTRSQNEQSAEIFMNFDMTYKERETQKQEIQSYARTKN